MNDIWQIGSTLFCKVVIWWSQMTCDRNRLDGNKRTHQDYGVIEFRLSRTPLLSQTSIPSPNMKHPACHLMHSSPNFLVRSRIYLATTLSLNIRHTSDHSYTNRSSIDSNIHIPWRIFFPRHLWPLNTPSLLMRVYTIIPLYYVHRSGHWRPDPATIKCLKKLHSLADGDSQTVTRHRRDHDNFDFFPINIYFTL